MALTWDATKVKDWSSIEAGDREWIITFSMVGGWGWELTTKNFEKAWARLSFYQSLYLPRDQWFTKRGFADFIGLRTNVAPISDAKFLKNIYAVHRSNMLQMKLTA